MKAQKRHQAEIAELVAKHAHRVAAHCKLDFDESLAEASIRGYEIRIDNDKFRIFDGDRQMTKLPGYRYQSYFMPAVKELLLAKSAKVSSYRQLGTFGSLTDLQKLGLALDEWTLAENLGAGTVSAESHAA